MTPRIPPTDVFWAVLERRHGLTQPEHQPIPGQRTLPGLVAADGTPEPDLPTTELESE